MAAAGTFVAVLGANGEWNEVFLLQPTLPGGLHWICSTTTNLSHLGHSQQLSGVVLQQGTAIAASDTSAKRYYPGLKDEQVNWMCDDDHDLWAPDEEEDFQRHMTSMSKWPAISEQCYFIAGGQTNEFTDLAMFSATLQSNDAMQPGRFTAILRGGFWHEVLLCLSGGNAGQWLCCTTNNNCEKIWTAVQLVPGSYVMAEGDAQTRFYPGVCYDRVYWMTINDESSFSPAWVEAQLSEAKVVAGQLGNIPGEVYCVSGGLQNFVPSIEDVLRGHVAPTPGKFVLIKMTSLWAEALLCAALANGTQWLCLTTTLDSPSRSAATKSAFIWTVVTLTNGNFFVVPSCGGNRHDTAYMADKIREMRKAPEVTMWVPTPQRLRKALDDAKDVMVQMERGALRLHEDVDCNDFPPLMPCA
jgi:hypothetical protein